MTSFLCPKCGGDAVLCACDALTLEDQRQVIDALQHDFQSLDHAMDVAEETLEAHNLLHIAAMEYIYANAPEDVRESIRAAFEKAFNIKPDYRGPNGERLFSIERVAEVLGVTVEEAQARAQAFLAPRGKRQRDGVTRVQ